MTQQTPSDLPSLPPELHEHISIFLPTNSITSLMMANRHLRSIYEKVLYRHIDLYALPHRSNALLRTFTLRPDLALLVRSLDIDLRPSMINTQPGEQPLLPGYPTRLGPLASIHNVTSFGLDLRPNMFTMPSGQLLSSTHPARLNALALARNVNSFGLSGVEWLGGEEMKGIREVVSKMRLTTLGLHGWYSVHSDELEYAARVSANLREVLQGQPGLLNLNFQYHLFKMEAPGVEIPIRIHSSDIARLRTLEAYMDTFASILPVLGDQLESLVIQYWRDDNSPFSATSLFNLPAVTGRIRKLHLLVGRGGPFPPGWHLNFGPMLASFPNIESLKITGQIDFTVLLCPEVIDPYIKTVASQITNSPNLTKLEISFEPWETRHESDPGRLVSEELGPNFKRSCPSLKRFIDPEKQEWVFFPTDEEGGGNAFQAIKVGQLYQNCTQFTEGDLPGVDWDV